MIEKSKTTTGVSFKINIIENDEKSEFDTVNEEIQE